jgi:hypothetical protein
LGQSNHQWGDLFCDHWASDLGMAIMGREPITYCKECGDAFDVYAAPEDRVCDCCKEFLAEREARATMAWFDIMEGRDERAS